MWLRISPMLTHWPHNNYSPKNNCIRENENRLFYFIVLIFWNDFWLISELFLLFPSSLSQFFSLLSVHWWDIFIKPLGLIALLKEETFSPHTDPIFILVLTVLGKFVHILTLPLLLYAVTLHLCFTMLSVWTHIKINYQYGLYQHWHSPHMDIDLLCDLWTYRVKTQTILDCMRL